MRCRAGTWIEGGWPADIWRAGILCCGLLGLGSSATGCARRAPGPDECRAFAARVVGIRQSSDLELRSARERYLLLTRECLTTPFDREFLQCTELGRGFRACHVQFEMRRRAKQ
ncbi:MAG TPA: hypothetical protein VFQ61_11175 [Polyangiaceae bacterium]|nr:hypothetical protein [Polyangiaceae bacterium]